MNNTRTGETFDLITEFYETIKKLDIDWHVKGLISPSKDIYALGSDSKLIGRIFEIIAAPIIYEIAKKHDFEVIIPDQQNTYPDFTLMKNINDPKKIAIDIKTTYKLPGRSMGYTLGSYASYIRNNTKNIQFPYNQYEDHYVIGFIYTRNTTAKEGEIGNIDNLDELQPPYTDVECFIQKKQNITGEKPGSGNTENIGSFTSTNIEPFLNGVGPFSVLPKEIYNHYWANYPRYRARDEGNYLNLTEYFDWLERINHEFKQYKTDYETWFQTKQY